MTLQDIKETKRYGWTDGRTHGQRENSIPTTNKVCGGYNSDSQGGSNILPQGDNLNKLGRGPLDDAGYQISRL